MNQIFMFILSTLAFIMSFVYYRQHKDENKLAKFEGESERHLWKVKLFLFLGIVLFWLALLTF